MLPSPDILKNFPEGKFVLANLAAKRAKELKQGAPPLVSVDSSHPLTIALAEIAAGKIKAILPTLEEMQQFEAEDLNQLPDQIPAEFGVLLPALDETEAAYIEQIGKEEGDHENEAEGTAEADGDVLAEMLGESADDTIASVASDDDTLSLSDIADAESADEENENE